MNRYADKSLYLSIILIMVAQGVVMVSAPIGQVLFAMASAISLWRCFALASPMVEKVRDSMFVGLSIALFFLAIWPK